MYGTRRNGRTSRGPSSLGTCGPDPRTPTPDTPGRRHERALARVADGPHDFAGAVLRVYQYYCLGG
jgi:hypothetical protein